MRQVYLARNFSCLTRLDHERVRGLLAAQLSNALNKPISNTQVHNVVVLGNHSTSLVPFFGCVEVSLPDSGKVSLQELLPEPAAVSELVSTVRGRGAEIIALRKLSSALSAAQAIAKHLRDWLAEPSHHAASDDFMSMGVLSNGNSYDVPEGLMFSFPCARSNDAPCGYTVVEGLPIPRELLAHTIHELEEERAEAEEIVGDLSVPYLTVIVSSSDDE